MEDLISKIDSIYNTLTGVLVFSALSFVLFIFGFLILFFWYYDITKKEEKKRVEKEIEDKIRKELTNK